MRRSFRTLLPVAALAAPVVFVATAASAHVGDHGAGLVAGLAHPLSGADHIAAMVAVGLWATLKGGRALWAWPAAFVGVMVGGAALGMAGVTLPFIEPGIVASVVVLGLMTALAIDLPVAMGAAVIALFALFHGAAHGMEVPETASGLAYVAGFAAATATLHLIGIAGGLALSRRTLVRAAGAATALVGVGLASGVL